VWKLNQIVTGDSNSRVFVHAEHQAIRDGPHRTTLAGLGKDGHDLLNTCFPRARGDVERCIAKMQYHAPRLVERDVAQKSGGNLLHGHAFLGIGLLELFDLLSQDLLVRDGLRRDRRWSLDG